jgi:hypothetical protein
MQAVVADDVSSVSSETSSKDEKTVIATDMRDKIKSLLEIDSHLLELKKKKSVLEKAKKGLSGEIMTWMKAERIFEMKTQGSILKHNETVSKPLGKKNLKALLATYFEQDPERGNAVQQYIFDNLPEKKTDKLVLKPQQI